MNAGKVLCCEFHTCATKILFQAVQLRRPWNGNDPGLLGQQPGKRHLCLRCFLFVGNLAKLVYNRLIGITRLSRKAWNDVAEVVLGEFRLGGDGACQKALAKRTERNEADAKLFQGGKNFPLRLAPPEGIFALRAATGCTA